MSSQSQAPQFVCDRCWWLFNDFHAPVCPEPENICRQPRPVSGWPTMPHKFREKFLLEERLGRGGMGAVFRAWNLQSGREVALKVAQLLGGRDIQERIRQLFADEAAQAGFLGRFPKNYVAVSGYDIETHGDAENRAAYLEMEYVELPTLHHLLKETPMTPLRVAHLGAAVAASLAPMHKHNLVHRDLKPANVFVSEKRSGTWARLFDFGLCVPADLDPNDSEAANSYPSRNFIPGTDDYMSPEQMDLRPLDVESDIHALGSILWRLSSNRVPFPAVGENQRAKLEYRKKLVQNVPPRPETMPPGLYDILKIALDVDPDKRFPVPPGVAAKKHTPALAFQRALEKFAADYIRERRIQTGRIVEVLQQLRTRTAEVLARFNKVATLATDARALGNELGRRVNELTDNEGEPPIPTPEEIDELKQRVHQLERDMNAVAEIGEKRARSRIWAWVPWSIAVLALGIMVLSITGRNTGGAETGKTVAPVVAPKVGEDTQKPKSPDPVADVVGQKPPVDQRLQDTEPAPTQPPAISPEPVKPPDPVLDDAQPVLAARPACQKVPVTFRFDFKVDATVGQQKWNKAQEITVSVPVDSGDVVLDYQESDSAEIGSADCRVSRPYRVDELIDMETCTAKPLQTLEACPR